MSVRLTIIIMIKNLFFEIVYVSNFSPHVTFWDNLSIIILKYGTDIVKPADLRHPGI